MFLKSGFIDLSLIFFRLRVEKAGGGWCPKQQVERGIREYLQVDLNEVHIVTGVQTQGRYDRGRGQEYAEEYTVEYWRPGLNEWKEYKRWDDKKVIIINPAHPPYLQIDFTLN